MGRVTYLIGILILSWQMHLHETVGWFSSQSALASNLKLEDMVFFKVVPSVRLLFCNIFL